ncbi:hypothetical protein CBS147339_9964 [Penicillium roqueforti]|nr:hypothetical protein CBS147339_9964 [Penicillium roqueforti]KAI3089670.1 hypothetical protein CBS147338_9489 [Penicillium roqueforti]KAI3175631.1 hypothetical protein DTO032C6_9941 [Penicillium roqueforti]
MNDNFDADYLNPKDLQAQVSHIHISGYINPNNEGDEDGNPPTNHWAAFLQFGDTGSVRIDMAPGYGDDGLRGKIDISSKSYTSTNNAIKTLTFTVEAYATVQTITELSILNGHDRYMFTEEWEGCRFWIYTFIEDLESAGLISEGSGQTAWETVSLYWQNPSGSEPRQILQGEFY